MPKLSTNCPSTSLVNTILWWNSTICNIFALFSPISSIQQRNDRFIFFSISSMILSGVSSSSSESYYEDNSFTFLNMISSSRWVFTFVICFLSLRTTPFTPWRHLRTAWSKVYFYSVVLEYSAMSSSWLKAPNLENLCFFFSKKLATNFFNSSIN